MEVNPELEGNKSLPEPAAPPPTPPEAPAPEAAAPAEATAPAQPAEPPSLTDESEPAEADSGDEAPSGSESPEAASGEAAPADPLSEVANRALRGRLSPADEERVTLLVKEALLEGRTGLTRAIENLPKLPWLVCVNGVSAAWLEMKPTSRTRLMAGLARVDSDAARRVRLSLARGLFKIDVPAAVKIAISIAKDMREKETGGISTRNAQILANVFIGRAKPWIVQLPLTDLKPIEIDLLIHTAVLTVFSLPHPPATQLGILKWATEHDRISKLQPVTLEAVKKGLSRWNPKWQIALKNEVKDLPEELASVLKAEESRSAQPAGRGDRGDRGRGQHANERPARERPEREPDAEPTDPAATVPAEAEESDEISRPADELDDQEREDREDREDEEDEERERERQAAPPQKQRPVYESKTVTVQPQGQGQGRRQGPPPSFNLSDSLRQIEQYVSSLRSELQTSQQKLRQRDDETRKGRRGSSERTTAPVIEGEPTPEELARLNVQLEARNAELQARLDEFRTDSEDRAASGGVAAEGAPADTGTQLRALLVFKLQEDYADFVALEKELPDIVVQQHYRALLRHVFEVLRVEGVALQEPKSPE
jgi:hypothetical protein